MATHSGVLAWRIPGTGVPGGLPSMGSHRVGHDWSDLAAKYEISGIKEGKDYHCRVENKVINEMGNHQGPTIQHTELCSILRGSLDERGIWGRMDTCICMTESLGCSPETITTLLINYACVLSHFSHVQLFETLWTVAKQAFLSVGSSRQGYWSGLPCLIQGIFPTQGANLHLLLHCRWILYRWATGEAHFTYSYT